MTYETAIAIIFATVIGTLAYFGKNIDADGIRNNAVLVIMKHLYLIMIPWLGWAGLGLALRLASDNSASQGVIDQLTVIFTSAMWINIITLVVIGLFIFQQFIMRVVEGIKERNFKL